MNILKEISSFQQVTLTLVICLVSWGTTFSQDESQYIYGTILTKSNETYEGFMRWGKEELAWHDTFNSEKADDQLRATKGKSSQWGNFDWSFGSLWKDKYHGSGHVYACHYGDIKAMDIKRNDRVDLELRNGSIIKVDGGSNDIGATIRMQDYELGVIKFDWDRIKRIEFFASPENRRSRYGKILYGTAHTRRGKAYTGYVKWDNDERCGTDILDGDSRNGDQKIPFEKIAEIEKEDDGSNVVFESGRSIFINGSNDCSSGNRGIHLYIPEVGNAEIPWSHFAKVEFSPPPADQLGYDQYGAPEPLTGEVLLFNGEKHYGQMFFDRDEMWDVEFLDGDDDFITYQIPFKNIRRIIPKNRSYSLVILKNGDELLLGDRQDVSNSNDGIVVIKDNNSKPISIDWDDVDVIHFYK